MFEKPIPKKVQMLVNNAVRSRARAVELLRENIEKCPHKTVYEREDYIVPRQYIRDLYIPAVRVCADCGYSETRTHCGFPPIMASKGCGLPKITDEQLKELTTWRHGESDVEWVHDRGMKIWGNPRI